MRVLIFGGRDFTDWSWMVENINSFQRYHGKISCIIHGDARGADRMGAFVGKCMGIPDEPYPAAWNDLKAPGAYVRHYNGKPYNANAGSDRNRKMAAANLNAAIGFKGGRGTLDMMAVLDNWNIMHPEKQIFMWNAGYRRMT